MSEITRQDLISDDALQAPLILADNLDKASKKFKEFRDSAIKTNEATQDTKSTKEATAAVEKLTAEQAELIKVNNQPAVQAKNNEAYAEAKRKVDDANAALKIAFHWENGMLKPLPDKTLHWKNFRRSS